MGVILPMVQEVAGIVYVNLDYTNYPGIGYPTFTDTGDYWFLYNGRMYYWQAELGYWTYREGDRWRIAQWVQWHTGPIVPMYPFSTIDADPVKGKPLYIWDSPIGASGSIVPTSSSVTSLHLDCRRWLRVLTYLPINDGFIEIPLLDANNVPWLSPERPWNVICRWCSNSTADNVTTPGANDLDWDEAMVCVRPGANIGEPTQNYSVEWSLHPATNPVPHWKLRVGITRNNSSALTGPDRTVLVDIVGSGYGAHASSSREQAGGSGVHWKQTLMWTQQGFLSTPSRTAFNERKLGMGVLHVANDSSPPTVPGTLYLTTGANEGLSTGTALFTDLPMVQVFGHAILGTDVSAAASTTWRPQSWGMGIVAPSSVAAGDPTRTRAYYSKLRKDSVTGHYRVQVFNVGWNGSTPLGNNPAWDRTYFVYALGK